ncbi:hypothetical protein C8Q74DRAFT_1214123 [Fomes fomentarius]|nr:hypothetical protein C8Q74DRAFT_1214123 [Fomes fomentarius]
MSSPTMIRDPAFGPQALPVPIYTGKISHGCVPSDDKKTAISQKLPRLLHSPNVTYLGLDKATQEQRFLLPIPNDTDFNLIFRVEVPGKPGLNIWDCFPSSVRKKNPNPLIEKTVIGARVSRDDIVTGPTVLIDRARMPEERFYFYTLKAEEKNPATGYTFAHMLTKMVKKQHTSFQNKNNQDKPLPEWMYIIEIRKSVGAGGDVRWFPTIEVRVPEVRWKAPQFL